MILLREQVPIVLMLTGTERADAKKKLHQQTQQRSQDLAGTCLPAPPLTYLWQLVGMSRTL